MPLFNRALLISVVSIIFAVVSGCTTTTGSQPAAQSASLDEASAASDKAMPLQEGEAGEERVADAQEVVEPGDPKEVICKRTKVTGSNFRKKVCQTRETWDENA